jgi:SAM-dependent methyltransferase
VTDLLELLRCPVCTGRVTGDRPLRCLGCGRLYPVVEGIPRLLDDSLPGIAEKRREIAGWVRKAQAEGWYREDDEVDAGLPQVSWDDSVWRANAHSFDALLHHYVRPGMRVLEVGAAKCWAAQHLLPRGCEYVATDILTERVGPFDRVQADGEHLPFADGEFDLTFCVATLHHALDLPRMVAELARVTRRGGIVAALNEGVRTVGASADAPGQRAEKELGINEHVHTVWAYVWCFLRACLVVRRVAPSDGEYPDLGRAGALFRLPRGDLWASLYAYTRTPNANYTGISVYASRLPTLRVRAGGSR